MKKTIEVHWKRMDYLEARIEDMENAKDKIILKGSKIYFDEKIANKLKLEGVIIYYDTTIERFYIQLKKTDIK